MALDKVVDSTQLDADLSSVADAIRTKVGSSESLSFPDGMVEAVENILTDDGTPDWTEYITGGDNTTLGLFAYASGLPEAMSLKLPHIRNLTDFMFRSTGCKYLTIDATGSTINRMYRAFTQYNVPSTLETITILGDINTIGFTSPYSELLRDTGSIRELNFIIDQPTFISGNTIRGTPRLETVFFKPNSAASNWAFNVSPVLTDASLVQIANSLKAGAYTLTLHATPKGKLTTILGAVSQVTNDDASYDFFTADASGSTTLLDFINNTKGWTVA